MLDAYEDSSMSASLDGVDRGGLAAALRAAANHLADASSGHTLYAIADELEGITYGTYRCHLKAQ